MYTYKLFNDRGLTIRIDLYCDGKYTGMSKTVGAMLPVDAAKLAQEDCDLLNNKVELRC